MGYIYKIWNDVNDNLYIGQTVRTLGARWSQHKQSSKTENNHLYLAIRKYGVEKFHIEEIEEVQDDLLNERECYWIQYYNSYYDGYNSTLGGEGNKNEITLEQIENLWEKGLSIIEISEVLGTTRTVIRDRIYNSKLYSEEEARQRGVGRMKKAKGKPIIQLDLEGNFIDYFNSGKEAEEKLGFSRKAISNALRRNGSSNGYLWKYANEEAKDKNYKKTIIQKISKDGQLLETYSSVKEASEKESISLTGIYSACIGKQKTAGGYIWKYS